MKVGKIEEVLVLRGGPGAFSPIQSCLAAGRIGCPRWEPEATICRYFSNKISSRYDSRPVLSCSKNRMDPAVKAIASISVFYILWSRCGGSDVRTYIDPLPIGDTSAIVERLEVRDSLPKTS